MYITIDGGYMDANISLTRSTEDFLLRFPRDGLDHHFGARTRDTFLANVPKKSCLAIEITMIGRNQQFNISHGKVFL